MPGNGSPCSVWSPVHEKPGALKPTCLAGASWHFLVISLGFGKFICLLLGSDERASPLGLVLQLVGNFTFPEMEVAVLDW